jgi:hypothetical protein
MFPYLWQLHFADGSILNQDAGDGGLREWAVAQRLQESGGRVARIVLVPTTEGLPAHVVSVPEGATPVYFRRMAKAVKVLLGVGGEVEAEEAPPEEQPPAIICAGWEWPPSGEYVDGTPLVGCYLFAFHDGSCVMTANRDEVQQ